MPRKRKDVAIFNAMGYTVTALFAIACLLPFALVISGSLTEETAIHRYGYRVLPPAFSTKAYELIFKAPEVIVRAYGVTIALVTVGTSLGLFLTAMTAYVLHRRDFRYRNKFAYFFFFTTLFSGGLIPWYILMVRYLGMKNNFFALVQPHLFSVFNIIIMRTFFKSIPEAIGESAKIDGAGDFTIFMRLAMPMSTPALATVGLFIALAYWNDWMAAMLFITDEALVPLQYFLYRVLNTITYINLVSERSGIPVPDMPQESYKLAMTVVATGPIIFFYPFAQKYFIKGLTIGAVKG